MSQYSKGIKIGDWTAFCQVCGRKFFGSTLLTRWDNVLVCTDDYEEKNEADTPIIIQDVRNVPRVGTVDLPTNVINEQANPDDPMENWYNNGENNII